MKHELSERLSRIIEQLRRKEKLERDLRSVKQELQERSEQFTSISQRLEEEKVDVEKLKRTSLTALFYTVLGSREQQLEKERQEFLTVQLQYQQTNKQVTYLEQDLDSIRRELGRLTGIEAEYQALLAEKEMLIRQSDQEAAGDLIEIDEKISKLDMDVKEIVEAIHAGEDVISSLKKVIVSLKSAKNWGTWDMLGGGLLTTVIKHTDIDDARQEINIVQRKMSRFTRELDDVRKTIELGVDIDAFESFADYFFDGLISDWIVQSKIMNSLERTQSAEFKINLAVAKLAGLKRNTQERIHALEENRKRIIESS